MREPRPSEQFARHEAQANNTWYKATVSLAHNGSGSRDEGIVFIFAKDAADAFNQLKRNKGGIKRNRTPKSITECGSEEVKHLLDEIYARRIDLRRAQQRGLKSVAPGELVVF